MNYIQKKYLATIASSPRTLHHFTHDVFMPSTQAEATLAALSDAGYIRKEKSTYYITQQGRTYLDGAGQQAAPRTHVAEGAYTGTKWHIRSGGEDHKAYESRGYRC